ncbi:MAG: universal stress protein [Nitrospirota bacterium]
MNILVAYDGTLHAKKALRYGIEKAQAAGGGALTVLQVFDRALFVDYDAGPRAVNWHGPNQRNSSKRRSRSWASAQPDSRSRS